MPCCSNAYLSTKLKKRQFSLETIKKMKKSALYRARKNHIRMKGCGQDWRRTSEARSWEKEIKKNWENECAISGSKENLHMHHFFSGSKKHSTKIRDLLLYAPLNGILLEKRFHVDFHNRYGYQENNLDQFESYIEYLAMLISSQAKPKCLEGSETRANDLLPLLTRAGQKEKILKLHERLEKIKRELKLVLDSSRPDAREFQSFII
uniref:putative HNH homing endonuclease n=1 Tax=Polulichloris maxima TaxID=2704661 RepID=UPI0024113AC7|nr:putative HNH homing endonuclease [Polulichloris maxima]WDY13199.1 putative HNH homing endonuclease [Polulichloris maxima]